MRALRGTSVLWNCFLLLALFSSAYGKDFYELLGIQRDASSRDIRRAFKKLAIKMHPDKNTDDPDAHAKFLRINRAYEVLKDDDLRRKYDLHGEKGLEDNGQQQYQSWNYYNQEFGLYDDDPEVVTLTSTDFDLLVSGSNDTWFINFYSPGCPPCHKAAPAWREMAREIDGVVRVGAVNCFEDGNVCNSQGVNRYPWMMMYNPRSGRYMGERSAQAFVKYVLDEVESLSNPLNAASFKKMVVGSRQPWLVHFCSMSEGGDCLSALALQKLSSILNKLVNVGTVDCDANLQLCNTQGVITAGTKYFKAKSDGKAQADFPSLDAKELATAAIAQLPKVQIFTEKSFTLAKQRTSAEPLLVLLGRGESLRSDIEVKKLPSLLVDMKVGVLDCDGLRSICLNEHLPHDAIVLFKPGGQEFFHGRRVALDIAAFARDSAKSSVRALGPNDFPSPVVHGKDPWFVDFFAPWCPPCQKLLPEFRKAAKELPSVKFGTVDCTVHQDLCRSYNIHSYPTTLMYNQTTPHAFHGQHAAWAIAEFANDILQPSVLDLTPESFDKLVSKRESQTVFVVDFYSPHCGPCMQLAPTWNKLAKIMKGVKQIQVGKVDCSKYRSFCQREAVHAYPTLRAYPRHHTGSSYHHVYQGWQNLESLRAWAYDFLPKISEELTSENFYRKVVERTDRPYVVDFYAGPWCGPCTAFTPEFEAAAREMRQFIIGFGKLNCDQHRNMCEEAGIYQYPSVKVYEGIYRDPRGGISINSQNGAEIAQFLQNNVRIQRRAKRKNKPAHEEL